MVAVARRGSLSGMIASTILNRDGRRRFGATPQRNFQRLLEVTWKIAGDTADCCVDKMPESFRF